VRELDPDRFQLCHLETTKQRPLTSPDH